MWRPLHCKGIRCVESPLGWIRRSVKIGDKSMGFAIDLLCLKIGEVASKKTFGILLSLGSLGCLWYVCVWFLLMYRTYFTYFIFTKVCSWKMMLWPPLVFWRQFWMEKFTESRDFNIGGVIGSTVWKTKGDGRVTLYDAWEPGGWFISWKSLWTNGWFGGVFPPILGNTHIFTVPTFG